MSVAVDTDELIRLVVVGHVDHGKSTVVGRLLADTNALPEGKLNQIKLHCEQSSRPFEYAFLLDALRAEQAQGITIDLARVFFKTDRRRYLILDAPGHVEFLRNMVTGAAHADAAVLVIDAEEGLKENSRRHAYMLSLLGISQVIVLVNKMDLVDYCQDRFNEIAQEITEFLTTQGIVPLYVLPASAREGVGIAIHSSKMPWAKDHTLLSLLDTLTAPTPPISKPFRMHIQDIYRFSAFGDKRRIVAGMVDSGTLSTGDTVIFFPSGKKSIVASIESFPAQERTTCVAGESVGFTLHDQLFITRGQLAVKAGENIPHVSRRMRASIFWLGKKPLRKSGSYIFKLGTTSIPMEITDIHSSLNTSTLKSHAAPQEVSSLEVGDCMITLKSPVAFDKEGDFSSSHRFVVVDGYTIAGGGIIRESLQDESSWAEQEALVRDALWVSGTLLPIDRAKRFNQSPCVVILSQGTPEQRKNIAKGVEAHLFEQGHASYFLGIGNLRSGLDRDVIDALDDRKEHLRRSAEVAHLFTDAGLILLFTCDYLTSEELQAFRALVKQRVLTIALSNTEHACDLLIQNDSIDENVEEITHFLKTIKVSY